MLCNYISQGPPFEASTWTSHYATFTISCIFYSSLDCQILRLELEHSKIFSNFCVDDLSHKLVAKVWKEPEKRSVEGRVDNLLCDQWNQFLSLKLGFSRVAKPAPRAAVASNTYCGLKSLDIEAKISSSKEKWAKIPELTKGASDLPGPY